MPEIVPLRPQLDCENIAVGLRAIADDIEGGKCNFDPLMAVVVLGRESEHRISGELFDHYNWQSHALGRTSAFTTKGLLAVALYENGDGSR